MKTYTLLVTIVLAFAAFSSNAQVTIQGTVRDHSEAHLPFVNIVLAASEDSHIIAGTTTDTDGNYIIRDVRPGNYSLTASMMGYETVTQPLIVVENETRQPVDFTLFESVLELNDVIVKGQKPLYEKLADRTVVNVQSATTAAGKSVLQVLSTSPGVQVNKQQGGIRLYGQPGVRIMINGKPTQLPEDAIVQMLDGMSAANIEAIELITSPPSQYDAEGSGGIINIRTIENKDLGTKGNASATAGFNKGLTWGTSMNISHRAEKFRLFADYSVLSDANEQNWKDNRTVFGNDFNEQINSYSTRYPTTRTQNLRLGGEVSVSDRTSLSMIVTGYKRNWDMDANTNVSAIYAADSLVQTFMDVHESNIWKSITAGVGLTHTFAAGEQLSMNFDVLRYNNDNPSTYAITGDAGESDIDLSKDTPIQFRIASADYTKTITDKFNLMLGTKATLSEFTNDVKVRTLTDSGWTSDEQLSSISMLDEKIWAAYASAGWNPSPSTSIQGGLRYEFTDSYLSTPEEAGLVDRSFGNLFPSLTITRKMGESQHLTLGYSKRITRPTFNDMAPFVYFTGPSTFFTGNPALLPAITDGLNISYQKGPWWVAAKYENTRNAIGWLQPYLDLETGIQTYRSENMEYMRVASITGHLSAAPADWWEITSEASLFYQTYRTNYREQNHDDSDVYASISATNTFQLPSDFSIELTGNFQSKTFYGIWEFNPSGQLDLGVRKSLGKGTVSLVFSDILGTNKLNTDMLLPDKASSISWRYNAHVRSVNITYSLNFGNGKMQDINMKDNSEEARKRVN